LENRVATSQAVQDRLGEQAGGLCWSTNEKAALRKAAHILC